MGWEDPSWRREWQPTPVFLPGKSHGQRSLAGYSSQGHKKSDTPEQQVHTHTQIHTHTHTHILVFMHFPEGKPWFVSFLQRRWVPTPVARILLTLKIPWDNGKIDSLLFSVKVRAYYSGKKQKNKKNSPERNRVIVPEIICKLYNKTRFISCQYFF